MKSTESDTVLTLSSAKRQVKIVQYSPDGRWIVGVGGQDGKPSSIFLWDAATGKLLRSTTFDTECAGTARISPDGKWLATSCWPDTEVQLWELPSLARQPGLALVPNVVIDEEDEDDEPETIVGDLCFSANGKALIAGCWDRRVKIWDLKTRKMQELSPAQKDNVEFVAVIADGSKLVSGTADQLRLWDLKCKAVLKNANLTGEPYVWNHLCSADGKSIFSVGRTGPVRIWESQTLKRKDFPVKFPKRVSALAASPAGTTLAIGFNAGGIVLWDVMAGKVRARRKLAHPVSSLCYSPDGQRLACVEMAPKPEDSVNIFSSL